MRLAGGRVRGTRTAAAAAAAADAAAAAPSITAATLSALGGGVPPPGTPPAPVPPPPPPPASATARSEFTEIWPLHLLDVADADQVELLLSLLARLPQLIEHYLSAFIFPQTMLHQTMKLSANAQELGGDLLFQVHISRPSHGLLCASTDLPVAVSALLLTFPWPSPRFC